MAVILNLLIVMILVVFDQQVAPILPTTLRVNWRFGSGEKFKTDFQNGGHGGHVGFLIRPIFARQVTTILTTKVSVSWPFR